jgi:hypothetical protein
MQAWECVEVKHHKDIGRTIEEYQRKGWRLYTYQVAGMGAGPMAYNVNHYLLFEKGEWNKPTLNFLLFLLKMD